MKTHDINSLAFNVNVVGAWNQAIFSPEWVKANLADDQGKDVLMAVSFPFAVSPIRLTVDGVNIYPSTQVLTIDGAVHSDESMAACARLFRRLAELLPHTPVTAMGINFRFVGAVDDSPRLAELFTFSDAGNIDANRFRATSAAIKRGFLLQDGKTLFVTLENVANALTIEFNFHCEARTVLDMAEYFSADRVGELKQQAINFLSEAYEIELDAA